jgi:hypothetical protein
MSSQNKGLLSSVCESVALPKINILQNIVVVPGVEKPDTDIGEKINLDNTIDNETDLAISQFSVFNNIDNIDNYLENLTDNGDFLGIGNNSPIRVPSPELDDSETMDSLPNLTQTRDISILKNTTNRDVSPDLFGNVGNTDKDTIPSLQNLEHNRDFVNFKNTGASRDGSPDLFGDDIENDSIPSQCLQNMSNFKNFLFRKNIVEENQPSTSTGQIQNFKLISSQYENITQSGQISDSDDEIPCEQIRQHTNIPHISLSDFEDDYNIEFSLSPPIQVQNSISTQTNIIETVSKPTQTQNSFSTKEKSRTKRILKARLAALEFNIENLKNISSRKELEQNYKRLKSIFSQVKESLDI